LGSERKRVTSVLATKERDKAAALKLNTGEKMQRKLLSLR
jgi:hypothetical protein